VFNLFPPAAALILTTVALAAGGDVSAIRGAASDPAVKLLVSALKDNNLDVLSSAALALARIETPKAHRAFNRHVSEEARRNIERD